jgi:hypothetical protein
MRVTALDGTEWDVTRRADGYSVPAAIVFLVLTIVGWVVAIVFALPVVLFVLELAALLILALVGRRDYLVAARSTTTGEVRSERVRGRRRSKGAQRALARELSGLA